MPRLLSRLCLCFAVAVLDSKVEGDTLYHPGEGNADDQPPRIQLLSPLDNTFTGLPVNISYELVGAVAGEDGSSVLGSVVRIEINGIQVRLDLLSAASVVHPGVVIERRQEHA